MGSRQGAPTGAGTAGLKLLTQFTTIPNGMKFLVDLGAELLQRAYPHALALIPSMTTVQFVVDPARGTPEGVGARRGDAAHGPHRRYLLPLPHGVRCGTLAAGGGRGETAEASGDSQSIKWHPGIFANGTLGTLRLRIVDRDCCRPAARRHLWRRAFF